MESKRKGGGGNVEFPFRCRFESSHMVYFFLLVLHQVETHNLKDERASRTHILQIMRSFVCNMLFVKNEREKFEKMVPLYVHTSYELLLVLVSIS